MSRIRAIDADGHVQEPADAWEKHLEAKYRPFAPRTLRDDQGRVRQLVGGELKPYIPVPSSGSWNIPAGGHDPKQRLADMDRQGVERSLLFPTFGLMFAGLERTDVQVALCRAYNDWPPAQRGAVLRAGLAGRRKPWRRRISRARWPW